MDLMSRVIKAESSTSGYVACMGLPECVRMATLGLTPCPPTVTAELPIGGESLDGKGGRNDASYMASLHRGEIQKQKTT